MKNLESSGSISKISWPWQSRYLKDVYLLENQADFEIFSENLVHHLCFEAWHPCAAWSQKKHHHQKGDEQLALQTNTTNI